MTNLLGSCSGPGSLLLCLSVFASPGLAQQAPGLSPGERRPAAPPALARLQGWLPLGSTGVPPFLTAHPAWDGRGVLIAILDTGIDPGVVGLSLTSTGEPKLLDLRDFSGEGRVALRPAVARADTILIGGRRLLGMTRVRSVTSAPWFTGELIERRLGDVPAADINDDGDNADSLALVVGRTPEGWALFVDAEGDGTLANDKPVHDYLQGRESFGWHRAGASSALTVAANFADDSSGAPRLDLVFDTEAHGTHVAGIASGHGIGGVSGFEGVAPGAQLLGLKISRNDLGGITTTGSVVSALEYAVGFAAKRGLPLVVNMSFGVGNEREGAARVDWLVDSILGAHPDVVFVTSAGNDGPGISTMGFPGSARRALTVGALQPAAFLPEGPHNGEPLLYFSSRGGELAKPDLIAPGTAYSTVPGWNVGDEFKSGTSMASPHVAGLAAILRSAAVQEHESVDGATIRRALVSSSRPLVGQSPIDEGAGVPDLEAAWRVLRAGDAPAEFDVDLPDRPGATAYLGLFPGDSVITFRITRTHGSDPVNLTLTSRASWLSAPPRLRVDQPTLLVRVRQKPPAAPGTYSGSIVAEIDGTPGIAFTLVSTVVVPHARTASRVSAEVRLQPGVAQRMVFAADSGRPFLVRIEAGLRDHGVIASLHQPGGQPIPGDNGIPAGPDTLAAVIAVDGRDVRPGYYEAVATGPFDGNASATLSVLHAPARLEFLPRNDSILARLRASNADSAFGTLRFGSVGAQRTVQVDTAGSRDIHIPVTVPAWASELVADLDIDPGEWPRFTDFGFAVMDSAGNILEKEPANYSKTRLTLSLGPDQTGRNLDILLAPGLADPGTAAPWHARVTLRFHSSEPTVAIAREGDAFRLPKGGATEFHAAMPRLPGQLPDGFEPLFLFLMESRGSAWTWELPRR